MDTNTATPAQALTVTQKLWGAGVALLMTTGSLTSIFGIISLFAPPKNGLTGIVGIFAAFIPVSIVGLGLMLVAIYRKLDGL
jgi:hypothetical protein